MNEGRGRLIIVRHGESEWNARGVWTGTTDVHLTPNGRHQARLLGESIAEIKLDRAVASAQIRTHETLDEMLDAMGQAQVERTYAAALNERDYGEYTGKNKWEVKASIGEAAFQDLRRGWDHAVPGGETLKAVYERTIPFYHSTILPWLNAGETVLVAAHGNSIRSLQKYIESISDEAVGSLEMLFGDVVTYHVDADGRMHDKQVIHTGITPPPA